MYKPDKPQILRIVTRGTCCDLSQDACIQESTQRKRHASILIRNELSGRAVHSSTLRSILLGTTNVTQPSIFSTREHDFLHT